MIVFVNGAFGIGKTTVARELVARLPRAVLFDPELAGILLQRVLRMVGRSVDDFQDLALWRRLTIIQIRVARMLWPNVVVPMAFSNAAYLHEIRSAVGRFEPNVLHFCLVAPLDIVKERLTGRGATNASDAAWQYRRAAECCALHTRDEFAPHVDAADREPADIAEELIGAVERPPLNTA